jgi:myo-inositol-1(or 4)-monophosphatase
MAQAAQDAAALLHNRPRPAPFTSWPEFRSRFETVDKLLAGLLRERLGVLRQGVNWAEELDAELTGSGERWVVDAVDGAVQYLQNLPQWSVSVTLVRDGRAVLAALHSATLGHTYTAALGGGAFLDGWPVTPSAKTDLDISLIATSQPPFPAKQPEAIAATALATGLVLPAVGVLRNLGPTSWQVADVAAGRIDAFWEYGRDAANLLGGALVAAEAGAVVTDTLGRPWHAWSTSFLAAAPGLHGTLVDLLRRIVAPRSERRGTGATC